MNENDRRRQRVDLLSRWQTRRDTFVLVLGTRSDASVRLHECLRYVYEHFRELRSRPLERIDLFFVGQGLRSETAARVAALVREYARELNVVITGPVGPGETLGAMAADAVLIHPMGTLTTILPRSAGGDPGGVDTLVHRMLSDEKVAERAYETLLKGSNATDVGDALHRMDWVRHQLGQLCESRLQPPGADVFDQLLDALTRRVSREGEPMSRREARAVPGLPVRLPVPEVEQLAFELHVAYEEELQLLSPSAGAGARALVESVGMLHVLRNERDAADGEAPQWQRHFDAPVH